MRGRGWGTGKAIITKGVRDTGTDVEQHGQADPEVCLGFEGELPDVGPFELARSRAGLVCAQPFDGFGLVFLGQEASGGDVVVEFPVDNGGGGDGDEADEHEDDLPGFEVCAGDAAEAVGEGRSQHGRHAVRAVPCCYADGLLGSSEPLGRDDGEEREASGLEEPEEEARGEEVAKGMAGSHAGLGNSPAEAEGRHQDAVRHFDDEVGGEGLPG